jgi:GNAT superfamily N-acetyltransferase
MSADRSRGCSRAHERDAGHRLRLVRRVHEPGDQRAPRRGVRHPDLDDDEWDWEHLTAEHSLGWVVARHGDELVGFVNVLWDGLVHAWIQDVMVAGSIRRRGVGVGLVGAARGGAAAAGCEWLHVDFDDELRGFYYDACGFRPTNGGLIEL